MTLLQKLSQEEDINYDDDLTLKEFNYIYARFLLCSLMS